MTALIENIRKVMGWCPNATAIVTKRSLQFDDLTLNAPDREGKINHVVQVGGINTVTGF